MTAPEKYTSFTSYALGNGRVLFRFLGFVFVSGSTKLWEIDGGLTNRHVSHLEILAARDAQTRRKRGAVYDSCAFFTSVCSSIIQPAAIHRRPQEQLTYAPVAGCTGQLSTLRALRSETNSA